MGRHKQFSSAPLIPSPALIMSCPGLLAKVSERLYPWLVAISSLPVNRFPNNLASKVLNYIPTNPPFCSFTSFLIFSRNSFTNKSEYLRDLTIFMILFISSLEFINVVKQDQNSFLWITASVAAAAAVNPNGNAFS